MFTQFPEARHHVNKCSNTLTEGLRQVSSEVVAQGEQVVSQVHAVVVLYGSQVRKLQQVLPGWRSRETRNNHLYFQGNSVGLICGFYMTERSLLVVCWYNIIEQLEDVPHSEEEL